MRVGIARLCGIVALDWYSSLELSTCTAILFVKEGSEVDTLRFSGISATAQNVSTHIHQIINVVPPISIGVNGISLLTVVGDGEVLKHAIAGYYWVLTRRNSKYNPAIWDLFSDDADSVVAIFYTCGKFQ